MGLSGVIYVHIVFIELKYELIVIPKQNPMGGNARGSLLPMDPCALGGGVNVTIWEWWWWSWWSVCVCVC